MYGSRPSSSGAEHERQRADRALGPAARAKQVQLLAASGAHQVELFDEPGVHG